MMILLLLAASIYFISGKIADGLFLVAAIFFQVSISLYQYSRSKEALEKLKELSQPNCKVIRNGKVEGIKSENLVVGDSLMVEEGSAIPADASIGNNTQLGKIGTSLENIDEEKTPLENQIENFVKNMAIVGATVFAVVWVINYLHSQNFLTSLLQSLTLAMSILPEEIPVAFTTFMALGAWRLMKMGVVVKQMKTVETLGSATVICTDKTGTITENKMSLAKIFILEKNKLFSPKDKLNEDEKKLLKLAMLASEILPFDPMEIALHQAYKEHYEKDERPSYSIIHEYPLEGQPPMMTHVFKDNKGNRIIAAKGAPEAIMSVSNLTETEKEQLHTAIQFLANDGYRLLGVAMSTFTGDCFPEKQQELPFLFKGIVAFYDPPKKNIQKVLTDFYKAGIAVKIITGDNAATTEAIAKQIGFRGYDKTITGQELMLLNDEELKTCVMNTAIFTRMFPEAKLKIINALKANNQIVAMTGDGVNDGPALKAAHIGIAMGKKGTEIAKQAASLILLEDDLSKMVKAVAMDRKIYTNLKKAIQYIISIHIPIILTVFIPLALGWIYPNIFSPIHIIFLEIIMGPTCSIIYENEPMEANTMSKKPKELTTTFFNWNELSMSILQGLIITAGTLFMYQYSVHNGYTEELTRTMVFTVLIAANIFLTLINRSFYYSILTTLRYKNNMVLSIIFITISIVALLLYVKPLTTFFKFETLNAQQLLTCTATGFVSVVWFEIVKLIKRLNTKNNN